MKCSACGTEIPDDAAFCYECGALTNGVTSEHSDMLYEGTHEENDTAEKYEKDMAGDEEITICPLCGAEIDRRDKFCRVCGVELDLVEKDEMICPHCGTIVKKNDSFCRECGYSFVPQKPAVEESTEYDDITVEQDDDTGSTQMGRNRSFAVFMLFVLIIINVLIVFVSIRGN